mgnify:FL=1
MIMIIMETLLIIIGCTRHMDAHRIHNSLECGVFNSIIIMARWKQTANNRQKIIRFIRLSWIFKYDFGILIDQSGSSFCQFFAQHFQIQGIQLFSVFIIGKLLPTQSSSKMEPLLPSRVSNIDPKTIESD